MERRFDTCRDGGALHARQGKPNIILQYLAFGQHFKKALLVRECHSPTYAVLLMKRGKSRHKSPSKSPIGFSCSARSSCRIVLYRMNNSSCQYHIQGAGASTNSSKSFVSVSTRLRG